MLGLVEVAQPVLAKVQQLGTRGQPIADEDGRHAREQHLAAVPDREQPRDPVERRTEEVAVACVGGPRVKRHPDPDRSDGMLGQVRETDLARERRGQARRRLIEAREEAIPGRLDDRAPVGLDRRSQDRVVGCEEVRHRLRVLLPEARAPLDVGHQEGRDGRRRGGMSERGSDARLVGHGSDHCTSRRRRQRVDDLPGRTAPGQVAYGRSSGGRTAWNRR